MADPPEMSNDTRPFPFDKTEKMPSTEFSDLHMEGPNSALPQVSEAADSEDEVYFSNNYQYRDVILTKNHVEGPCQLDLPADFIPELPSPSVPVDLRCGGKNWSMMCSWNGGNPSLFSGWETFVRDNDLKSGDACVFELRESSELKMKFKVVILRSELPRELLDAALALGNSSNNPIEID